VYWRTKEAMTPKGKTVLIAEKRRSPKGRSVARGLELGLQSSIFLFKWKVFIHGRFQVRI
jgi:hypothetical protein